MPSCPLAVIHGSMPTREQAGVVGTQPVKHVYSKLPGRLQQIVRILFLHEARAIIETGVTQLGTLRKVNQSRLLRVAKGEFQRVDPKSMMPWGPFLQLKATDIEGEFAQK